MPIAVDDDEISDPHFWLVYSVRCVPIVIEQSSNKDSIVRDR